MTTGPERRAVALPGWLAGSADSAPPGWSVRAVIAGGLAIVLAVPVNVSVGDLDLVAAAAQALAVTSVFLLLPAQFAADAAVPRRGGFTRLLVLALIGPSVLAWAYVAVDRGVSLSAVLSLLNWAALGGLVVAGQVLFGEERRLVFVLRAWAAIQTGVALLAIAYLFARFGLEVLVSTSRGPFQLAMHEILPNWPNGAGLALAVAACIPYGQIRGGYRGLGPRVQFAALAAGVLLSFSRSAWLACLVSMAVMTLVSTRPSRSVPLMIGVLSTVLLAATQIPTIRYQVRVTFTPGSSEQLSILQRVAFAVEAFRLWREHPIAGIGFARFEDFASLARLSAAGAVRADYVPGSVHNEYLSTLLKGGLLSAIPFLVLIGANWRRARRLASDQAAGRLRGWGIVGLGLATVLLVGGLGGESFRQVSISAPYWILAGALSVIYCSVSPAGDSRRAPLSAAPAGSPSR